MGCVCMSLGESVWNTRIRVIDIFFIPWRRVWLLYMLCVEHQDQDFWERPCVCVCLELQDQDCWERVGGWVWVCLRAFGVSYQWCVTTSKHFALDWSLTYSRAIECVGRWLWLSKAYAGDTHDKLERWDKVWVRERKKIFKIRNHESKIFSFLFLTEQPWNRKQD